MSFKTELAQALQNLSGKSVVTANKSTTEMLAGFNAQYLCLTTFAITPNTATIVVKKGTTVLVPDEDGKYALAEGSYTYSVTATGYTPIVDAALTITNADETTGSKTVTVVMTTCVVTFATTPADATVVVKSGETVVTANQNGTYNLIAGTYSYTVSKEGYTPLTDEELIISAGDVTTGTKTVTVEIIVVG